MRRADALFVVKLVHTMAWAFFAGCVIAIPVLTVLRRDNVALWAAGAVLIEVLVLAVSGWRCPLTPIAARYTDDRRANFDIFLPEWLARYNKEVFGSLYAIGLLGIVARWLGWI